MRHAEASISSPGASECGRLDDFVARYSKDEFQNRLRRRAGAAHTLGQGLQQRLMMLQATDRAWDAPLSKNDKRAFLDVQLQDMLLWVYELAEETQRENDQLKADAAMLRLERTSEQAKMRRLEGLQQHVMMLWEEVKNKQRSSQRVPEVRCTLTQTDDLYEGGTVNESPELDQCKIYICRETQTEAQTDTQVHGNDMAACSSDYLSVVPDTKGSPSAVCTPPTPVPSKPWQVKPPVNDGTPENAPGLSLTQGTPRAVARLGENSRHDTTLDRAGVGPLLQATPRAVVRQAGAGSVSTGSLPRAGKLQRQSSTVSTTSTSHPSLGQAPGTRSSPVPARAPRGRNATLAVCVSPRPSGTGTNGSPSTSTWPPSRGSLLTRSPRACPDSVPRARATPVR